MTFAAIQCGSESGLRFVAKDGSHCFGLLLESSARDIKTNYFQLFAKDSRLPALNHTLVVMSAVMARPRFINPNGEVVKLTARIPEKVARDLQREAQRRGVTVGQVVRERLAS